MGLSVVINVLIVEEIIAFSLNKVSNSNDFFFRNSKREKRDSTSMFKYSNILIFELKLNHISQMSYRCADTLSSYRTRCQKKYHKHNACQKGKHGTRVIYTNKRPLIIYKIVFVLFMKHLLLFNVLDDKTIQPAVTRHNIAGRVLLSFFYLSFIKKNGGQAATS